MVYIHNMKMRYIHEIMSHFAHFGDNIFTRVEVGRMILIIQYLIHLCDVING